MPSLLTSDKSDAFLDLNQLDIAQRYIRVDEQGKDFYALKTLMEDLGIKRSELAQYLNKTSQDLQSWASPSAAEFIHIKSESDRELICKLITLLLELRVLINDVKSLRAWMRLPNRGFGGKPPLELVLQQRTDEIISELFPLISGNVSV